MTKGQINDPSVLKKALKKFREKETKKGLKPFQILGVSEELKTRFRNFATDKELKSNSALDLLLKNSGYKS